LQLIQQIDKLEISYFGKVETQDLMIQLIHKHKKEFYTVKYPKNPNQAKNNPEFFSKKVGDKLLKMQTIQEMMDESCDVIK